jgi:V8-like Glu-specific endopeptidase
MRFRLVVAVTGLSALVATVPLASAAATGAMNRQSRASHVAVAGGNVYLWSTHRKDTTGGACTLSFTVRSATHHDGVLTAGHCVDTLRGGPSYTVHQTRAGSGNRTYLGDRLGAVDSGRYHVGSKGDSAFIALADGRQAQPRLFTGGRTSGSTIAVVGLGSLHGGLSHVCYSGATSGEHCGYTIEGKPRAITFTGSGETLRIHHEWSAVGACHARPGDSGAPVFVRKGSGALAVGILSGGGRVGGHCAFFFTPVKAALKTLHLTLLTGS